MSEPAGTAPFTITVEDWVAGQFVRETKFLQQVLENLQWLKDSHNHDGSTGGGGIITTADPKAIMFYGSVSAIL